MISIEKFDKADFDRLISWIGSEELLFQFAGPVFTFPLTRAQLSGYLEDNNRIPFKIVIPETGEVIGHSEIYIYEGQRAKLCRILIGNQQHRGKGLGEQLVRLLSEYAFHKLNVLTLELNVYEWNIPAIKCYEKVGFRINPDKVNSIEVKGNTWISLNMTLNKIHR